MAADEAVAAMKLALGLAGLAGAAEGLPLAEGATGLPAAGLALPLLAVLLGALGSLDFGSLMEDGAVEGVEEAAAVAAAAAAAAAVEAASL